MRRKLLLADDSVTIQRVIELTFSGEDVHVVAVDDGEQAIARIPTERPDVVLADIGMPKRNGYEVAAFVNEQPELKHIPVLLLAGAFEPVDEAKAREVGCAGVLVKPFEPQQVIARVRELLEPEQGKPAPPRAAPPAPSAPPEPPQPSPVLEFPRKADPRDTAPPEPQERFELPLTVVDDRGSVAPELAEQSLDDYFDRLDAAFATLDSASVAHPPPAARDEVGGDDDLGVPTIDDLLATAPPRPAGGADRGGGRPEEDAGRGEPPGRPDGGLLAEAFRMLLALEQGEPGAQPVRLTTAPAASAAPAVTDALVEEITSRVLQRLAPDAVRSVVAEVVSEVTERLVREEIDRIRRKHA